MSRDARPPADQLIGRERELGDLRDGLARIRSGYGRVLLVDGEPGIGKTRLAEEVAREAAAAGMTVAWGACQEGETAPPLWPWTQILRGAPGAASRDVATRPSLARLLGERASGASGPAALGSESSEEPFELFGEVASLLRERAENDPLLVVLDDLHCADRSSLRLLQFLSREIRLARIGILGTYREPDLHASAERMEIFAGVLRGATPLSLRGLSREETGRLVALVRAEEPSDSLVSAVYDATGGSPFFTRELARLPRPTGRDATGRLPIPESVRATIRERLARLPAECVGVLEAASVLAQEIDPRLLEAVLEAPAERIGNALEAASLAAIVLPGGGSPAGHRFAHALIRETLYAGLSPQERAELHGRAGRAIERLHAANLAPHLDALAHHFERAGLAAEAVAWRERAGVRAFEVSAYEEAIRHFEAGLALAEGAGPQESVRARLFFSLGQARKAAGNYAAGNADLEHGAEAARRAGDRALVALAALEYAGYQRRSDRIDVRRVKRLEDALAGLGEEEPVLRSRLISRLAFQRWLPTNATEDAREALEIARRTGDPLAIGEALFTRFFSLHGPDVRGEAEAIFSELSHIAETHAFTALEWQTRMMALWYRIERGDVAGFGAGIEQLEKRQSRPVNRVNVLFLRSAAACLEGRFDEAAMLLREADALAERFDHTIRGVIEFAAIEPEWWRGRLAEVERRIDSLPPIPNWTRSIAAAVYAELGRDAAARREIEALGDFSRMSTDPRLLTNLCDLTGACIALGDRDRMVALHERLEPHEDRLVSGYITLGYRGSVASWLGRLDAALGRDGDALRRLEAGLARNERVGVPHVTAASRVALAEHLAARGETARARELLEAALAVAQDLGTIALASRAEGLRTRLAGPGRPPGEAELRNEGEYWTVAFGERVVRLKDSKGLRDLAVLLSSPGREVHVADLIARDALEDPAGRRPGAREIAEAGLTVSKGDRAADRLDRRARDEYRGRLADLREELDEAERARDSGRVEKARRELDFIAGELASAYGLGGRARTPGDSLERARKAVSARLRYAIDRIRESDPALARHLDAAIRTGSFCSYSPADSVRWTVTLRP